MRITRVQAEALGVLATRLRPDWDHPGVMAAIERARDTADALDLCRALLNLAGNPALTSPGMLPKPGRHWTRADGAPTPRRGDHTMHCPDHPDQPQPCPQRHYTGPDLTTEEVAANAAALREELRTHRPRDTRTPGVTPTPADERLEAARARVDRERHTR